MRFWHKLVSSAVLAVLIMLPFLTLAMCVPGSAAAAMHCPPGCPMMAKSKGVQPEIVLRQGTSESCCTIQSSKPAPVTESRAVPPVVSIEPMVESVPLIARAAHLRAAVLEGSSPPLVNSQAKLCTFQI